MPINIAGYALSNNAGLALGASASRIIASNYGVKDPSLPGFMGAAMAGGGYKVHPFPVNDVNPNIGSVWSTSTYRFTAPVAGIYYISYSGIVGDGTGNNTYGYFGLIVNGAAAYYSYKDTVALWELHHQEMMINLAAGDTVSWSMNAAPGPDSGNVCGGYQINHNTCTIWLVG